MGGWGGGGDSAPVTYRVETWKWNWRIQICKYDCVLMVYAES
jgi:hypothetical protein